MDNGAGSSGSIIGGAVCEADAGLVEVVLMWDISMLRETSDGGSLKCWDSAFENPFWFGRSTEKRCPSGLR